MSTHCVYVGVFSEDVLLLLTPMAKETEEKRTIEMAKRCLKHLIRRLQEKQKKKTVTCRNTDERRTTLPERSEAGATSATRKVERCVRALPGPCCTEEERRGRGPERRGEQV